LVHELGHALIIRYVFGARPWIILYGLGGLAGHHPSYSIRRPKTLGRIFISFGGPLAGFLLAGLCFYLAISFGRDMNVYLFKILWFMFVIGAFWGIINLLPVLPLDGGNICREVCLWLFPWRGEGVALQISMISAIIVAVVSFMWLQQPFLAVMFGLFAVLNYQTLQGGRRY